MLEPEHQDLIFNFFYKGLTMAEISRRDGIHKSSVARRMTHVLAQLKKILKNFE
jgi:DNA-directed RNA polymerase specialized sigma24 family protein